VSVLPNGQNAYTGKPSNFNYRYIAEGESTAGYSLTACVGSFACPGINTPGVLVYVSFNTRQSKSSDLPTRWSVMGIEPTTYHAKNMKLKSILLVLSHMFGFVEQKLLGRSRKSLVFLESNFFSSEKFQVSVPYMFCRNKKFWECKITISCTFAVIQIFDNIGSLLHYFLADFNETDVPSYVEKYPKIQYTISDRPHNLIMDLCKKTSF
jgi:hypothetical protein